MQNQKLKLKIYSAIVFVVLFVGLMIFLFAGGNVKILQEVFKDDVTKEEVRESLEQFGWRGYITLGLLSMMQVVFAFLPAEPVQVISGLSFGLWKGGLVCLTGVFVGNTLIYVLYKIYGNRLTKFVEQNLELDFEAARKSYAVALIIFILYFLPAIPYGLICIFAASLDIKYPKYILLTTFGSIPSILIGVGLGHIAIASSWVLSIIVFLALILLLAIMFKNRSKLFEKVNEFIRQRQKCGSIHTASKLAWGTAAFGSRFVFDGKVKVQFKNQLGKIQGPAIVLCNHGSFIDFVYTGRMLRKSRPHYVVARLYFYHKWLGKILRHFGCIPKSMFSTDVDSTKNCMRVLSAGKVLTMMPEARLSTIGKYEGIQDTTFKFIQHANVAVYVIRSHGSYFANPKWGDGARKGAWVQTELKKLFDAGEVKTLSLDELKARIDEALDYDEFAWLDCHPELSYPSKTLAEGLENILYLCPSCGSRYTMATKGREITCECCGMQASLGSRYEFTDEKPFKNFAAWYEWQEKETEKLALADGYKLESKVELRHGSIDGKACTRVAGEGYCVLDKSGLTYKGTRDGEEIEKFFPMSQIYRLLFGAGEDFEIYEGKEIWYFRPENKRSCVEWYVASGILKENEEN